MLKIIQTLSILLYFTLTYQQNEIESIEVEEVITAKNSRYIALLEIGTPPQKIRVKISTSYCGLWLLDKTIFGKGYDPRISKSLKRGTYRAKIAFVNGTISKETLKIGSLKAESQSFLLVDNVKEEKLKDLNYEGLIGLGYKCATESAGNVDFIFSFIHDINNRGKDIQNLFTFDINDKGGNALITIGAFDKRIDINSKMYKISKIDRVSFNGQWQIGLFGIFFDNNEYFRVREKLMVGIGKSFLSVTQKFFDFVVLKFFQNDINNKVCYIEKNEMNEIYCNGDYDISKLGNLHFIVGKWYLTIKKEKLFSDVIVNGKNMKWCRSVFHKQYDYFYISQILFSNTILVYNQQNDLIGFYKK